jgi:YhcH/YjgK/YiaL family protein
MVIDKIENQHLYAGLSSRIDKALNYISKTDLVNTELGKYEIDEENVVAIVQEYISKNPEDARLESHFEHIDIQYIISGEEMMGIGILENQIPHTVINEKDVAFYPNDSTPFKLKKGMFAILYPNDLHCPGMKCGENSKVKKLVVKIRI